MNSKTFRAPNMLLALQQAKRELGSDAIVVSMRKVPGGPAWQVWRNPMIEIIASPNPKSGAVVEQPETYTIPKKKKNSSQPQEAKQAPPENRESQREAENSPSVAETIRSLSALGIDIPTEEDDASWKPYIPPKVSGSLNASQVDIPISPPHEDKAPAPHYQAVETNGNPYISTALNIEEDLPPLLSKARDQLLDQELAEEMVIKLITNCKDILPKTAVDDESRVRYLLQRQLEAEIQIAKNDDNAAKKIAFLIGPSGAGKTSSCAKLAAHALHSYGRNVLWASADTIKTGGVAESRTHSELLDLPLRLIYTPQDLQDIIKLETNAMDWILVDMPDCNPRDENSVVEQGKMLTTVSTRTTYIILPATMKESDLNQVIAAFKPFRIDGLIITKIDETLTLGNIYNVAWRSQVPLAFFINGTHALDSIQPAAANTIVNSLFGEGFTR